MVVFVGAAVAEAALATQKRPVEATRGTLTGPGDSAAIKAEETRFYQDAGRSCSQGNRFLHDTEVLSIASDHLFYLGFCCSPSSHSFYTYLRRVTGEINATSSSCAEPTVFQVKFKPDEVHIVQYFKMAPIFCLS